MTDGVQPIYIELYLALYLNSDIGPDIALEPPMELPDRGASEDPAAVAETAFPCPWQQHGASLRGRVAPLL